MFFSTIVVTSVLSVCVVTMCVGPSVANPVIDCELQIRLPANLGLSSSITSVMTEILLNIIFLSTPTVTALSSSSLMSRIVSVAR